MKTLKTATNKIVFEKIKQREVLKLSKVQMPRIVYGPKSLHRRQ